ncbi:MAG: quinolinate synthase NadA [Deltaproteobacteria bacterium]|jgi:quinolinate synthase|nr:quinolinate synthase NadA [Deltaproteobacteria bacterium]
MNVSKLYKAIEEHRKHFGKALTIMGHHYQADEVIRHTDLRGDSLELSRQVSQVESEQIIFCGVYFMAESAALLARPGQKVHLPEPSAECSMAMMSPAPLLDKVLELLTSQGRKVLPLVYVNSTLAVKASVGRHNGAACTSANARAMLDWALKESDAVLFLPDRNLGQNMAKELGLPLSRQHILNIKDNADQLDLAAAKQARLLLWPGFCSIHTRFNLRQIERVRQEYPGVTVIVHPECTPEVVAAADKAGSTSFIIRFAAALPAGSTLAIGTEINLVERLAAEHQGRITIVPLVESACTHMAQTTEESLGKALDALQDMEAGGENQTPSPFLVRIPEEFKVPAKATLERMFKVCGL